MAGIGGDRMRISRRLGLGVLPSYQYFFDTVTNLSAARSRLGGATDGDGKVLFGGGTISGGGKSAVVNIYTVEGVRTNTSLSGSVYQAAAATDGNGNVLFCGDGLNSVVNKFNTAGTRSSITISRTRTSGIVGASDGGGNVLFTGGGSSSIDKISETGVASTLANGCSDYGAGAKSGSGAAIFAGGGMTYPTDIVRHITPTGVTTNLAVLALARVYLAAGTDGNGNVLFAGGRGRYTDTGNLYDTGTVDKYTTGGVHSTLTSLSSSRAEIAAVTDINSNVFFAGGGTTGGGFYTVIDVFTPSGVRTTMSLGTARSQLAAARDGNGNMLFAGGMNSLSTFTNKVDRIRWSRY